MIGDSIGKTAKRGDVPTSIIQSKRKFIQLDPNDEDSRVLVPITEKKLNKLKLFYFIKRNYPKFVNSFLEKNGILKPDENKKEKELSLEEELKNMEESKSQSSASSKVLDGSPINSTNKQHISVSNGTANITEGDELDEIISNVKKKPAKLTEENLDEIMSNLMQKEKIDTDKDSSKTRQELNHAEQSEIENINSNVDHDSTNSRGSSLTVEAKEENKMNPSLSNSLEALSLESSKGTAEGAKEASKCVSNQEIGCMMHELVDLFHETYVSDGKGKAESSSKGIGLDFTGETRGGGDPYATIGHSSIRHGSHDGESVHANRYYDKNVGK